MRQIVLAALAYMILNLFIPTLWERFMSSAPEWMVRGAIFGGTLVCLAFVTFAPPVYSRITQAAEYPVTSTAIVAVMFASLGATFWWSFMAKAGVPSTRVVDIRPQSTSQGTVPKRSIELGTGELRLDWGARVAGMDVCATSEHAEALAEFQLAAVDVRKREGDKFVQVPELHGSGAFEEIDLLADKPTLFFGKRHCAQFLFTDDKSTFEWLSMVGVTRFAPGGQTRAIPHPGIWQVTFRYSWGGGSVRHGQLMFEWTRRKDVAPWRPPRPIPVFTEPAGRS